MDDQPQWVNDKGESVNFMGNENEQKLSEGIADGGGESDREKFSTLEAISELAYETRRRWEKIIGEPPSLEWDQLSDARQREIMDGVLYILGNPTAPVRAQHDYWRATKASQGAMIPADKMVEFVSLSWSQQRKAILFRHIVHAIVG